MPEQEPSPQEATYSKIPDETISVEDFGVRATVNVWHTPTPKIKTTFERLENTDDDLMKDELWVRMEKKRILTAKTTLLGLQAISLYLHEQLAPEGSQTETLEPIIPILSVEVDIPTVKPEPEIIQPEINHEPLLIESLKPGDVLPPIKNVSELALFEAFLATEIQPNGIWGETEKWSIREPLKDLIKKFTINGAKFNGSIAGVQLEVMPNPAGKLLEANESKQEANFIFSEKLPYKPSAKLIAAIKSGTIGFVATVDFTSTKGLYGTVQSELWYTKIDSRSINEVKRYMTRPVIVELHETSTETADSASPARRRWPMSDLFQSHSSRRATLR